MALIHSPQIVTNGLVFYYDIQNTQKSWLGQPTTNLVGDGMGTYNNVSGDVSASLTTTGEYYKGAAVYKLILTPTTASGVSWLSNGNNPGIGVVSGGGGGTANRYTGHSIFFKSTVPLSSTPIYTHYSNIAGWQSSSNNYAMGDGWYKAHVIWYDTVTRSDGKYWAINPLSATLNVPIVIYWAGPFKEDRNDSTFVAQYTPNSRSNTQAIRDLVGGNTITATSLTYASDGTFSFNGSSGNITSSSFIGHQTSSGTIMGWAYPTSTSGDLYLVAAGGTNTYGASRAIRINSGSWCAVNYGSSTEDWNGIIGANINTWQHVAYAWSGTTIRFYFNGVEYTNTRSGMVTPLGSVLTIGATAWSPVYGYFPGKINTIQVYNRALTSNEVTQNFAAQRGIYGL